MRLSPEAASSAREGRVFGRLFVECTSDAATHVDQGLRSIT
jgi:hypothetical protein